MKSLLLVTLVGLATALPAEEKEPEVLNHACGGSGGDGNKFNDELYAIYGPITGFEIWHGGATCVVDGIRLRYGSFWGPKHSNKGSSNDRVEFAADETLVGIDMDKRTHWGNEVLCQITIFSSKRVYGPYCNHDCNNLRCGNGKSGNFRYISGKYGANLDYLEWHQ